MASTQAVIRTTPIPRRRGWQEMLAWAALALVPIYLAGLFARPLAQMQAAIFPRILYLIVMPITGIILADSARRIQGRRRMTWLLQSIALWLTFGSISALFLIRINVLGLPKGTVEPITNILLLISFLLELIGAGLYFPRNTWRLGSTWRLVCDSVLIGLAFLACTQSLIPVVFGISPATDQALQRMLWVGADLMLVVAMSIMLLRFARQDRPILMFALLSTVSLTIGDAVWAVLSWVPNMDLFALIIWPLYMIAHACLALTAYWDVQRPPQPPPNVPILMSGLEWWTWTYIPRVLVLITFAATVLVHPAWQGTLIVLLGIWMIREILAGREERALARTVYIAEAAASAANTQLRAVQAQTEQINHELTTANQALEAANAQLRAFSMQAADLAVEQERTRVAREIHDGLGRHLDALNVHLGAIEQHLGRRPDLAQRSLQVVGVELEAVKYEVRQAIHALLADDTAGSLEEALASDVHACVLSGIALETEVLGPSRLLPAPIAHALYRMAQEALNNVRRHAFAQHARLILDYRNPACVRLTVADDGQGFDPQTRRAGRGLTNMCERAALIGGTVRVQAAPGRGVTMTVEVPTCDRPSAS